MTTGKNKEQFEGWYRKNYIVINGTFALPIFYTLEFKMQIGVYLAYYDSLDIRIHIGDNICSQAFIGSYKDRQHNSKFGFLIDDENYSSFIYSSRNEAYKEVFKKADELINQQN